MNTKPIDRKTEREKERKGDRQSSGDLDSVVSSWGYWGWVSGNWVSSFSLRLIVRVTVWWKAKGRSQSSRVCWHGVKFIINPRGTLTRNKVDHSVNGYVDTEQSWSQAQWVCCHGLKLITGSNGMLKRNEVDHSLNYVDKELILSLFSRVRWHRSKFDQSY